MYGLQWAGAVMWFLLQSECLMLRWLFPSQAAAYGLIYGYDMVASWTMLCEFVLPNCLSHWLCCFLHCRWYHVQQDFRPTKSAAEPEAHPHSSTNGSTSAYKALGAYPSGEMSSQERHHCTWRTLCRRSLKIRTRGSQSWTRTSSGECLRLRSSRNASSWNPCPARRWRITSGWCRGCRDHALVCSGLCCKRYQVYWTWNQDFRARVLNLAKLFFPLL